MGVVVNMNLNQLSLPSGKVAGVDLGAVLEEPLGTMVIGGMSNGCWPMR